MSLSSQRRSRKQEERLGERIGGNRVAGSGSGPFVKNDVRNNFISIEAKTTTKKSFSLKEDDLVKAERHALMDSGREFAFVVQMASGREWVIVSREFAEERGLFYREVPSGTPNQT